MDENTPTNPTPPPLSSPPAPPPISGGPVYALPRKKGRGWMVVALILFVLLVVSLLANLGSFATAFMPSPVTYTRSGPRLEEMVLETERSDNKVAVIPVEGVIMSMSMDGGPFGMVEVIRAQLERAEADSRVKAVVLKVESPGGEVLASDEIYHEISQFQQRTGKPVIASMGNLAASGGYYVSAPCRWIVANEMTLTGSIGVIMSTWNYRTLMDKVGVLPLTFKSGRFKDMLSGTREPSQISPEETRMVQNLVDEIFQKFKTAVAEGRAQSAEWNAKNAQGEKGRRLAPNWEELADGRVLSGTQAFENGFVDELGNFDRAVERAKKLAGITRASVVEYRQHYDLSDILRIFGKAEPGIKVDVGLDLPKLKAGQVYFLSPTLVQ